jgi:NAD(P)-dependent dehydrogenase (short-subunit alcohol dehydrogenase family)
MPELMGQTVAIVGASSGIGLATAKACAAEGASVIMLSRSEEKLREAAKTLSGAPRIAAMDMLDRPAVARVIASIGALDHLVLTAAAEENARRAPITELNVEQVERSLDKLRGFINVTQAAAPNIRERGSIVLFSGASAVKPPRQGMSVLAAVNASIVSFGKAAALELAPIRVNVVMPGVVDTGVWPSETREKLRAWAESPDLPARRFGQPEDIAHAVIFLMTNPYVTAHTLNIDGGLLAT